MAYIPSTRLLTFPTSSRTGVHSSISKGLSDKFKSLDEEEYPVNADLKKKRASYWSDLDAAVSGWDQRMPRKESSLQMISQVNGLEIYS